MSGTERQQRLLVLMSDQEKRSIKALAKELGMPMGTMIRVATLEFLKRHRKEK